jgi:MurNAc alpha-1-phosphate uridylyltransferase
MPRTTRAAISASTPRAGPRAAADKLTWASVGLFKPGLFADIAPGTRLALRPKLEAALDAGRLAASRWDGPWTDVGTVERLNALNAPA